VQVDTYVFLLLLLSETALIGLVVYLVFYVLFQKLFASRIPSQRDEVSELPVMSGFIVEKPDIPSLTKMVVDILRRAWRSGERAVERGIVSYLSDWYVVALLVLVILVALVLLLGW